MKKELINALNLPSVIRIDRIETKGKEVIVFCHTEKRKLACPHCSGKTNGYDTVKIRRLHTVLNGRKVWLALTKQRLRCKTCGRVFTEPVGGITHRGTTDFFDQLVQEKSRNQDYSSVGRELGISPMTVMRKQDLLSLEKFYVPEEEEIWLGLDGKYLNGEDEIFVLGDVKHKKFLGVTKNGSADTLKKVIRENLIEKGKKISLVTMDMSRLLKGVVRAVIGAGVPIVADRFHVVKHVNAVISLCRVAVEKGVNERFQVKRLLLMKNETLGKIRNKPKWEAKVQRFMGLLKTHPELRILWYLKNRIHVFYETRDEKKAAERFRGIIGYLDTYARVHPEFADLKATLLNWETEIMNFFKYHITNAYIEGLNNRIETLKRKRFGFRNKERFIKTLLFAFLPITMFLTNLIFTH